MILLEACTRTWCRDLYIRVLLAKTNYISFSKFHTDTTGMTHFLDYLVSFLVGLNTYQHPCITDIEKDNKGDIIYKLYETSSFLCEKFFGIIHNSLDISHFHPTTQRQNCLNFIYDLWASNDNTDIAELAQAWAGFQNSASCFRVVTKLIMEAAGTMNFRSIRRSSQSKNRQHVAKRRWRAHFLRTLSVFHIPRGTGVLLSLYRHWGSVQAVRPIGGVEV